jgi:hypothetical protein
METQGKKRVLSFEEFISSDQGMGMDQTLGSAEPMMINGEPGSDMDQPQVSLEKEPEVGMENEPEAGMDLTMMDEPQEKPEMSEPTEEKPTETEDGQSEMAESVASWFKR